MSSQNKTQKYLRLVAHLILLLITTFWFVFALLSGAEGYGGGIMGVIKNSPNALPWLFLFLLNYIAFKWELVGGILIAGMGVATIFSFDAFEEPAVLLLITLPLILLGGCLGVSWYLARKKKER